MSILPIQNGPVTGQTSEDFKQAQMFDPADFIKPFHVKITPGTDLYIKIADVAIDLGISPTKAARVLMLGGWMGWRKFRMGELKREATDES